MPLAPCCAHRRTSRWPRHLVAVLDGGRPLLDGTPCLALLLACVPLLLRERRLARRDSPRLEGNPGERRATQRNSSAQQDSRFLVGMVWCPHVTSRPNGGGVCTWPPEAATSSGGGVCTERQTSKSEPVYLPSSVADKISPNLALSERLSEVSSAILARRRRRKLRDRSVLKPFLAMVGLFLGSAAPPWASPCGRSIDPPQLRPKSYEKLAQDLTTVMTVMTVTIL